MGQSIILWRICTSYIQMLPLHNCVGSRSYVAATAYILNSILSFHYSLRIALPSDVRQLMLFSSMSMPSPPAAASNPTSVR
jgi:hypothetical protein